MKTYVSPALRAHGKVEALTQGTSTGESLDRAFPVGTPKGQLTFS